MLSRSAIAFACIVALSAACCQAQSLAPISVRTIAGGNNAGFADGTGVRATFLMPSAVAFGPHRILYVADAAAQRIRAIAPNGSVTTVAGGGDMNASNLFVPGAFRDGSVRHARFSHPSGLAVRADGGVYVADTFNHCIRLIAARRVSTAAGRCGFAGSNDGSASLARLAYPRGLALSSDGTLYIADQKNGLRALSARGDLRTIPSPSHADFRNATGVAAFRDHSGTVLYIANADRLVRYEVRSRQSMVVQDLGAGISINRVQGGGPLGRPYSIAATDANSIIYGDLRDGSVRYVEDFLIAGTPTPHLQYVGGAPPEDVTLGLSDRAALSAPMGIAVDGGGRIAVADAIQRKIFIVRLDQRRHAFATGLKALAFSPRAYRIAIEGNSFVFFAAGFADSIAGLLQARLRADRALRTRDAEVASLYSLCPDPELLSSGLVDLAILIVDAYNVDCSGKHEFERDPAVTQHAGSWQQTVGRQFSSTVAALSRAHVRTMLLLIPMAWEFTPLEDLYRLENVGYYEFSPAGYAFPSDYRSAQQNWLTALAATQAPLVDTFDSFRAFELSAHQQTLYATDDLHLSKVGRERVADVLAADLERAKPWQH
ncbi:MAG: hypothetical protein JO018_03245 [Candidatus Eremiobacteraeota bacterium]|nr:hypothetical protein [Candidatus Eremiobacteraeota bacterium]